MPARAGRRNAGKPPLHTNENGGPEGPPLQTLPGSEPLGLAREALPNRPAAVAGGSGELRLSIFRGGAFGALHAALAARAPDIELVLAGLRHGIEAGIQRQGGARHHHHRAGRQTHNAENLLHKRLSLRVNVTLELVP